jgi:hypothetical protein
MWSFIYNIQEFVRSFCVWCLTYILHSEYGGERQVCWIRQAFRSGNDTERLGASLFFCLQIPWSWKSVTFRTYVQDNIVMHCDCFLGTNPSSSDKSTKYIVCKVWHTQRTAAQTDLVPSLPHNSSTSIIYCFLLYFTGIKLPHRTSRWSDQSFIMFGKSGALISARRPTALAEVVRPFLSLPMKILG